MSQVSRHIRLPALVALVAFTVASVGCSYWRSMPTADATSEEWEKLKGKRVELTTDDGVTTIRVESVEYPFMYGIDESTEEQSRVDLREVHNIRVRDRDTGMIIVVTTLIVAVVVGVWFFFWVMLDAETQEG